MVNSETIENNFDKKIEQIDKEFLNSIKNIKEESPKQLEEEYKLKLKQTIQEYEKHMGVYFGEQKKTFERFKDLNRLAKKEEKEEVEEESLDMSKAYKARHLDLELSKKQRTENKKELTRFKRKIRFKNAFRKHAPSWSVLFYFRLKIFWRDFKFGLENLIFRIQSSTRRDFARLIDIVKEFLVKVSSKLKQLFAKIEGWVKTKILKKKNQPDKEKSEDQKIAAKLLKKK